MSPTTPEPAARAPDGGDELILERPYADDEAERALRLYDLYHDLLDLMLNTQRRRHGVVMIDGHSMTSIGRGRVHDEGEPPDNVVVGTLGGSSADDSIVETFVGTLRLGTSVTWRLPHRRARRLRQCRARVDEWPHRRLLLGRCGGAPWVRHGRSEPTT